jgi:O-antigen ligase
MIHLRDNNVQHSGSRFALAAWLGVLSLSFFLYTEDHPFTSRETRSDVLQVQIAALCSFFMLAILAARFRIGAAASSFIFLDRANPHSILTLFFLFAAVLSIHARAPLTSLGYAVLTWLAFIMSALSWPKNGAGNKDLALAGLVMALLLVGLLVVFGSPKGRLIGGNQPNALGQAAIVAISCGSLAHGAVRMFIIGVGLCFIYLVGSRSSALAILVFFLIFVLTPPYRRILPRLPLRGMAVAGLGLAMGIMALLGSDLIVASSVGDWLRLSDPASGIGSGLTGRTALMATAIETIMQQPFLGSGFRMEFVEGGHSGYLSLLGETGIIGGLLFLSAVGWMLLLEWQRASNPQLAHDQRMVSKVSIAFLGCNLLVLWAIEPLYISLGFPTQALLIYFLARPLDGTGPARRRGITGAIEQRCLKPIPRRSSHPLNENMG